MLRKFMHNLMLVLIQIIFWVLKEGDKIGEQLLVLGRNNTETIREKLEAKEVELDLLIENKVLAKGFFFKSKFVLQNLFFVLQIAIKQLSFKFIMKLASVNVLLLSLIHKIAVLIINITRTYAIELPPGYTLLKFVDLVYHKRIVEGVFSQIVYDWREEYFEGLKNSGKVKLFFINVRWRYNFVKSMLSESPIGAIYEEIKSLIK